MLALTGPEVSELISAVEVFDRKNKSIVTLNNQDCGFRYRNSIFKSEPNRYVVLYVTFTLKQTIDVIIKYDELASKLGVKVNESAPAKEVFNAVRQLRASKGMLLDETDRDTYSVGSFFLNPRISAEIRNGLPAEAPCWLQPDGMWKVSAAWLINKAGFERGYQQGNAGLSTKHSLAIVNLDNATAEEILSLAKSIQMRVADSFGIRLEFEPQLI